MRSLLLSMLLALGCSADPIVAPRDCTPGSTSACACPGASGVQTCTAEGVLGACVCADAAVGADAGDAVSAAVDAPEAAVDAAVGVDAVDVAAVADVLVAPIDTPAVCDASTQDDPANCGACGNVCPRPDGAAADCRAGVCSFLCRPGFLDCNRMPADGCEASAYTDTMNCGMCGRRCGTGEICELGRCKIPCADGFTRCSATTAGDGDCRNLQTDRSHCGACGMFCPVGMSRCSSGACVPG